jgi:hypothetical protein
MDEEIEMRVSHKPFVVALAASALLLSGASCASDKVIISEGGTSQPTARASAAELAQSPASEGEAPVIKSSLRQDLEAENTVLLGTVLSVQGGSIQVSTDEVLSAGLQAKQNPDRCPSFEVGYRFVLVNSTPNTKNDLGVGEQGLFVGEMCDEYRDGQMLLVTSAPNARRVSTEGTIDLGGGDIITVDEARRVAGISFAPVPVANDLLRVTAALTGDTLDVEVSGSSTAAIGITLCEPGLVTLTSPQQDYFGRCSLQTFDAGTPYRLVDGRLSAELKLPPERTRPFDVVVFGADERGFFQIRGIASVE